MATPDGASVDCLSMVVEKMSKLLHRMLVLAGLLLVRLAWGPQYKFRSKISCLLILLCSVSSCSQNRTHEQQWNNNNNWRWIAWHFYWVR